MAEKSAAQESTTSNPTRENIKPDSSENKDLSEVSSLKEKKEEISLEQNIERS